MDRAEQEFRSALGLDARTEIALDRTLRPLPSAVRVRFEVSGRPYGANGVRVRLDGREAVASDGGATFESVEPGRHRLRVDRIEGWKAMPEIEVDVHDGRTSEVVVDLRTCLC